MTNPWSAAIELHAEALTKTKNFYENGLLPLESVTAFRNLLVEAVEEYISFERKLKEAALS